MRFLCCLSAALLATGLSARADVFNLSGTFADNTKVSGTLVIDTTTGVLESGDLSYLGQTYNVVDNAGPAMNVAGYVFLISTSSAEFPLIDFLIDADPLVGFDGAPLCSLSHLCPGTGPDSGINFLSAYEAFSGANDLFLQTGAVTPTPEPSSVALLGTGLLGFAGLVRRRLS